MKPKYRVTHTFGVGDYSTAIITKHVFIDDEEVASIEGVYRWDEILGGLVSIDLPTGAVKGNGREC